MLCNAADDLTYPRTNPATAQTCAYHAVITLATVGSREMHPLTDVWYGQLFIISLVLMGMGLLLALATSVTAFLVEGEILNIFRRRKMDKALQGMRDHYIVCGAGATGTYVIEELLGTAREAVLHDTPVLGINLGRLGFLVDISPDDMQNSLNQVFDGNYETDKRSLLEARVDDDSQNHVAFNDIVLHKWNTARLIEFETFINHQFVDRQRSDGLIISTPTGSTAYALSGGGPLIHPALDAMALVPICPHTLSNRPIVIDAASKIEIRVCAHTPQDHLRITCDGQNSLPIENTQSSIVIQKHDKQVSLIHPPGHDHFQILRNKLGWGKHHTN